MKPDAYTKAVLTLILVCLIVICVAQIRLAASAQKTLALSDEEQGLGKGTTSEAAESIEVKKHSAPLGFNALPFTTF